MFIELLKGVSLLLALSYLQTFNKRIWVRHKQVEDISSGILFGFICVIGMNIPIVLTDGVIFDARSVITGMAGLFGGPIVALTAGAIAGTYRIWLGGSGMYVGVAVIASCAILGVLYHYVRKRGWIGVAWWQLLLFGLLSHLWVIFLFTFLPPDVVVRVMNDVALPFVLTFTPATLLLGLLLLDIEQRFNTEQVLRDREAELSLHVQNTPLAAISWDSNFVTTQWNKSAERIFGYTAEEAIGRPASELIVPDKLLAELEPVFETLLEQKGGEFNVNENVTKDGRRIICEWYNTPIVNRVGEPLGVSSLALDITERLETERNLENALAEAERANQVKSEFLARLSHELRTPLNAIIGFSEVLRMRLFGPLGNEKYDEYARNIHTSGKHLLALINDVLDISTIEAGERKILREPLDIAKMAKEATDLVSPDAESRSISLRVDVPDGLPELYADQRALRQILLNLLSNSIKYSDAGATVILRAVAGPDTVTLEVADNGVGIEESLLPTITDVFSRGDANPQIAQEGTGLGLAIVNSLVEAHMGRLDIDSVVGQGTTVRVTLPREDLPKANQAIA